MDSFFRSQERMDTFNRAPICLIIPPSVFLLDERVFVSLGILKVASVLEQNGYHVEMLDLSGIRDYQAAIRDYLATSSIQIFGITSTTPQMPQVTDITREIREVRPNAKIILGGPHVTLIHTAARKERIRNYHARASKAMRFLEQEYDVLVSGDGEKAILEALRPGAPKLVNANELKSPLFISRWEFDTSPFPARHLIDMSSYYYEIDRFPATSLVAQLGCPFSCGFCGGRESPCLRVVRIRSTESILQELASVHETYGYTGFMFYDDELNVNPNFLELLEGLVDLQLQLGTRFHLRGFVKAELFNERQAKMMYQAGFRWILSGFETGSPRILENINKRATRDDNTRCVETARMYGLKVKALMSLGHPGESLETVDQTRDWLLEVKPDDVDVTIITPYPGTGYYDRALPVDGEPGVFVYTVPENGDKLYSREIDFNSTAVFYKGDPNDGYRAYTWTNHLTSQAMLSLRSRLEKEIREKLNIPFNPSRAAQNYEHSMGQAGELPQHILKTTQLSKVA